MNQLKAEKRKIEGRKVKDLRKEGVLPANVYGKGIKSESVQVDTSDFLAVFKQEGETGLFELVVGSKKHPVLVHNVQYDPVTDEPLHADFHQVNLKEKTTAQVPLVLIGESPAEKKGEGTLVTYIDEVEVEALPADLPEKFEVDVSGLDEVDKAILVKDLAVDKKVEIKLGKEEIVAKVEPLREEEELPPPTTEAEVEEGEEGEKEAEEGKKASEGEKAEKGKREKKEEEKKEEEGKEEKKE